MNRRRPARESGRTTSAAVPRSELEPDMKQESGTTPFDIPLQSRSDHGYEVREDFPVSHEGMFMV
jgi:hypothetical protein